MSSSDRAKHRDMILSPSKWPLLFLPLKRRGSNLGYECAVFTQPLNVDKVSEDAPIEIRIGTIFENVSRLPTKKYTDVDALLDDGWVVD